MADGVKIRRPRKRELIDKFRRLAPAAAEAAAAANKEGAEDMARLARKFAPVKSGALRDSIKVTPPGGVLPAHSQGTPPVVGAGSYAVSAGNSGVRYAHLIEFGTLPHTVGGQFAGAQHPGTPPRPFFFPAYRVARQQHKKRVGKAVRSAYKKVAKS